MREPDGVVGEPVMAEFNFKTSGGKDPAMFVLDIAQAARPTVGDALFAAQRQRSRIVQRTYKGVDVDGAPFEPYNSTRPYYYYPSGRVGRDKFTIKQNKAAVNRFLKKTAGPSEFYFEHQGVERAFGSPTRGGQGIRYASYQDFKESLGRAGVDLTGAKAPHMLQAIVVSVNGRDFGTTDSGGGGGGREAAEEFAIGIYGAAGGRAKGHNTGFNPRWSRRHQRRFVGASNADLTAVVADIRGRISARVKATK